MRRSVTAGLKSQKKSVIGRSVFGTSRIRFSIHSGHAMDIYDISWCPNSQHLVSSGTDSNVIIWDIEGIQYTRIHDHSGYIQGIEWTQDDNAILSVSNDRTARVYSYSRGNTTPFLQVDDLQNMRTPKKEYRISKNIVNNKPCEAFH